MQKNYDFFLVSNIIKRMVLNLNLKIPRLLYLPFKGGQTPEVMTPPLTPTLN